MKNIIVILSLFINSLVWGQTSCACIYTVDGEVECFSGNCGNGNFQTCLQQLNYTWYQGSYSVPSGMTLCAYLIEITMPVEFGDYFLVVADGVVVFNWYTYSEVNCLKYEIEIFSDKSYFLHREIPGNGNVSYRIDYSTAFDNLPKDLLYLKLTQTDYNGDKYNLVLTSIDYRESKGVLVRDLLGREVTTNYTGVVVYIYSDGTIKKVYQVSN